MASKDKRLFSKAIWRFHVIVRVYSFFIHTNQRRKQRNYPLKEQLNWIYFQPNFLNQPKKFPIVLDVYFYGQNTSFIIYRIDSEPVGAIIRSKEVTLTIKSLFL